MGLLAHMEIVRSTVESTRPDILAATETKTLPKLHRRILGKRLRQLFPDYVVHLSSCPPGESGRAQGGVALFIAKRYATPYRAERVDTPDSLGLAGYLAHSILHTPVNTCHTVGVYVPDSTPEVRTKIYCYLRRLTDHCKTTGEGLICMGDWNATLLHSDRPNGHTDTADRLHREQCHAMGLTPVGGEPESRPHTFFRLSSPPTSSRIDDILYLPRPVFPLAAKAAEWTHTMDLPPLVDS